MEFFENQEKGIYKKGLFDEDAKRWAQDLRNEGQGQDKLKSSQFRNYFHEFRRLEDVFDRYKRETGGDEALAWNRLTSQIELLRAKLAYGGARTVALCKNFLYSGARWTNSYQMPREAPSTSPRSCCFWRQY